MTLSTEVVRDLALHVKKAVAPHLGAWRSRRVAGVAASGDATFHIDEIAERAVEEHVRGRALRVAYYTEDRGLVLPDHGVTPNGILIIDPIDGTRGAMAGFEACVVSVALTDYLPAPRLADVRCGVVAEIKGDLVIAAERGSGIEITRPGSAAAAAFTMPTTNPREMGCSVEVVGAPLDLLFEALGTLTSATTLSGGLFILNSSAYELTRLVTGQLAAVIDVRNRLLKELPESRNQFVEYGDGRLVSLYGYDVAAAALIASEGGCVLTDAWGKDLSRWKLLDTSEGNFGSLIAATNRSLHTRIVEAVDAGFRQMRERMGQGAGDT